MTLERSSYQMSSDRVNELLSRERQLFAIADVWSNYKQAKSDGLDGANEFVVLARKVVLVRKLDAVVKEANPTEPMCVYCGWSGEGLAEHERDCKPMWAVLDGEGYQ